MSMANTSTPLSLASDESSFVIMSSCLSTTVIRI